MYKEMVITFFVVAKVLEKFIKVKLLKKSNRLCHRAKRKGKLLQRILN